MAYTDKEMQEASLLAYMELDPVADKNKTLKQIIDSHPEYITNLEKTASQFKPGTIEHSEYQERLNLLRDIQNNKSECANWVVREPVDHAETTGFAACVYETGDGKAIVAFRGSNGGNFITGEDNPGQFQHDWVENDFGLHNCKETPQQAEAKRYMEQLYRKYGDRYEYGVTGHSLGGNLAESAAIEAPEGMQKLIKQVVSMDGPGFSQEYIDAHQGGINRISDKIVHYQWSPIGGLLTQPGKAQNYTAGVEDLPRGFHPLQDLKYIMYRHDSCFVRFDENGNIIRVKPNPMIESLHQLTLRLDDTTFLPGLWAIGELLIYKKLLGPIYPVVRELTVGIQALVKKVKKKSRSKYKNVDFSFDFDRMMCVADETMHISQELYDIADELDVIRSKINSLSLCSVKLSARTLSNRISSDGKKAKKMGKTISDIVELYVNSETELETTVESI